MDIQCYNKHLVVQIEGHGVLIKGGQYRVQKYRGTFFGTSTDGTFSKMVPKYRYRGTFLKKYSVFLAFSCLLSIEN